MHNTDAPLMPLTYGEINTDSTHLSNSTLVSARH